MQTTYTYQRNSLLAEIKSELVENVFELYESTPLGQRSYFCDLGMAATSEADFNEIFKECLKTDKVDQQIALQNHINIETRNMLNTSINKLNNTTKQIQEDARIHASQAAEQNRQIAMQNERNLRNQGKAIGEIKKQNKLSSELEYQIRHKN